MVCPDLTDSCNESAVQSKLLLRPLNTVFVCSAEWEELSVCLKTFHCSLDDRERFDGELLYWAKHSDARGSLLETLFLF